MSIDMSAVYEAWEHHVPGVTTGEVDALLPLVMRGLDRVPGLVAAYRAGRGPARPPSADPDVTVIEVSTRHNRDRSQNRVALDIGGHLFLSIAIWPTESGALANMALVEEELRHRIGLTVGDSITERARA